MKLCQNHKNVRKTLIVHIIFGFISTEVQFYLHYYIFFTSVVSTISHSLSLSLIMIVDYYYYFFPYKKMVRSRH
jgi:molybdopterin-binding protein